MVTWTVLRKQERQCRRLLRNYSPGKTALAQPPSLPDHSVDKNSLPEDRLIADLSEDIAA